LEGAGNRAFLVLMKRFTAIDAHVGGEAVRVIVAGAPSVRGGTMAEKHAWLKERGESLRQNLMLEPRGHDGMQGVLLTEPANAELQAGALFLNSSGFPLFSGEAIMAAVSVGLENGLIHSSASEISFDTPAGVVRAKPMFDSTTARGGSRVRSVQLTGVPSFVVAAGIPIQVGNRRMKVDVAFGGEFFAILDGETAGVPLATPHAYPLIRAAGEIARLVEASITIVHPSGTRTWKTLAGVIFTGPSEHAADLRTATVLSGGILRRSPGVADSCALMAVLDAMGMLVGEQRITHEGILGSMNRGWVASRENAGDLTSIVPVVEAVSWTTGRHEFELDSGDDLEPFRV